MNLRVLEVAEAEAVKAALRYDKQRSGLGGQFIDAYENALDAISTSKSESFRLAPK